MFCNQAAIVAISRVIDVNCVDIVTSFITGCNGSPDQQFDALCAQFHTVHRERYGRSIAVLIPLFAQQLPRSVLAMGYPYAKMRERGYMANVRFWNAVFLNKHREMQGIKTYCLTLLANGERIPVYGRRRHRSKPRSAV